MDALLAIASTVALDVFAEAKMPCAFTGFSYFDRVKLAIIGPPIVVGVLMLGGLLWSWNHHRKRRANKISMRRSTLRREKQRGSQNSIVKTALWKVAAPILLFADLIFPTITRTLPVNILHRTLL